MLQYTKPGAELHRHLDERDGWALERQRELTGMCMIVALVIHIYVYMYTHIHTYMCMSICVYMYIIIHILVYIYIYIYRERERHPMDMFYVRVLLSFQQPTFQNITT